jgi:hypothetical protein
MVFYAIFFPLSGGAAGFFISRKASHYLKIEKLVRQ